MNSLFFMIYTAPLMQCTMNKRISDANTGSSCDQWSSKLKYNQTFLEDGYVDLLYIDYNIFGDRFDNQLLEGSVRPANLAKIIINTDSNPNNINSTNITTTIKWEAAVYNQIFTANKADTQHALAVETDLFCPGIVSDFWISFYVPTDGYLFRVTSISVINEKSKKYTIDQFCQEGGNGTECVSQGLAGYYEQSGVDIGGGGPDLVTFFFPDCLFDYANDTGVNDEVFQVLGGINFVSLSIIITHY